MHILRAVICAECVVCGVKPDVLRGRIVGLLTRLASDVPILGSGHPPELRSGDFDQNIWNIKEFVHSGRKCSLA